MTSPPTPSPALPPPPGQQSNFVNPVSLWKWDVLAVTVCLFVSTIVFGLRTYVRLGIKREWIPEDYMCCVSYALFITFCALMTTVMNRHGGVHEWDLTVPQVHEAIYWFNVTSVEYGPAILFTKLTILLMYRRIFSPRRWSPFNIALRSFEVVLILFYIAITITKIWECRPRARIWDKSIKGTCIDIPRLLNTSGLFNTISDLLILLVPLKAVWNLNMKWKKKLGVIAVFSVGTIAPVFSMIGFVVRIKVSANPDATYNQPTILLWATAEISTGIICICLPTLAALAHARHPRGRPTPSIINGQSNSRSGGSLYYKRRKQANDSDDVTLFQGEYVELREPTPKTAAAAAEVAQGTVVTGIKGGVSSVDVRQAGEDADVIAPTGYREDAEGGVGNIVKTVRIEQSYV